jgi:two-component system, cell cycle sensor histidine kinase and response regulator CckA
MKILVIDDNPDHRELVRAKVRKAYPDAEIVEIIRQSMLDEKLSEGPPDMALTDYRLHWSDGLQVLEQIKRMYPETPVIMVTDTGSEEVAAAGMKSGLADYILKDHLQRLPIAMRESLEKIRLRRHAESERAQLIREQAARAEAEAGERRYRSLAEAIPQMVWTADAGGRFDYYNRRWFEYSGLGESESFEHDAWKHVLYEEDAEATLTRWRGAVKSGEGYEIEARFRRASDGAFRWHLCRAIPLRNPDGVIAKWFGTCTDIDDQKRSAESMREAQKLESIGLLAGGVAHDFNNLLTGILGNASLALELVPQGDALCPLLENVVMASERAADLTQQLLAYSGRGRYFVEPVHLSHLVREIGVLIQSSIPKKVTVRFNLADDLPLAEVDPTQIRQLVMNLVINGAEAIGEDRAGFVTVSTFFQPVDEIYLASLESSLNGIGPGDYIAVRVADDGCGMDESVRQHIFDPFFTTKFTGRGLGLAAALGIVRGHRGAIRIQSAPGRGSVFEVLIPAAAASNDREPKKETEPSSSDLRGDGTILVIDDEEIVRKSAKSALERYGYSILLANDGLEGVQVFRKYRRKITGVLLDMMMPVMGGEGALQEIRAISPLTPVIGSSGYSEALALRYFGDKGLAGFLQKPYAAQALAECVKRAVEGRTRSHAG